MEWSLPAQEDFERRLRRARPDDRGEYLRITGISLEEAGLVDAARDLWWRVAAEPGWSQTGALELLGDSLSESDPDRAEECYRRLIDLDPTLNGTSGMAPVRLAGLLIRRSGTAELAEARDLLAAWWEDDPPFTAQRFPAAVAEAQWHVAAGALDAASEWAALALELAEEESPLPSAPGLAVGTIAPELDAWLRSLAAR